MSEPVVRKAWEIDICDVVGGNLAIVMTDENLERLLRSLEPVTSGGYLDFFSNHSAKHVLTGDYAEMRPLRVRVENYGNEVLMTTIFFALSEELAFDNSHSLYFEFVPFEAYFSHDDITKRYVVEKYEDDSIAVEWNGTTRVIKLDDAAG